MFDRRSRMTALASMLLSITFSFVGGCSSDGDTNPIVPGPTDQAPPLAPTGVGLGGHAASKVLLRWAPNADPDLAGYKVYMYDPDPARGSAFRCVTGANPWRSASFTYPVTAGTSYCFRVTAIDTNDNESSMSDPLTFSFSTTDEVNPGASGIENGTGRGEAPDIQGHSWVPNENGNTRSNR